MTPAELVKQFEGLRLEAYQDTAGVWTVGFGHTGPDVRPGARITEEEALELLAEDLAWAEAAVGRTVRVPLTEGQRAAVVSLVYNIGSGAWERSTALKRLNAGDCEGAADAMAWWNKVTVDGQKVESRGLRNRREKEREIFLSDMPSEAVSGPVTGGEHKPVGKSKTSWLAGVGLAGALSQVLGVWKEIRVSAPELYEWALPYVPWVFLVIFAGIVAVRLYEWKVGEH